MRRARLIALAAAVAGAVPGCTGPEIAEGAPCNVTIGPRHVTYDPFWEVIEMPDLEMQAGDTVVTDLRDYYGPVECLEYYEEHGWDDIIFEAESSDPAAIALSVADATLTTVALAAADSVRVAVLADPDWYVNNRGSHVFVVRVRPR